MQKTDPRDAETKHVLGISLAQSKQYEDALQKILAAIQLQSNNPAYFNSLGNVYRHLNQLDQAIEAFDTAIDLNPTYAIAYNNLGNTYYSQKKMNHAQSCYEKALELQPDYVDAKNNLCNLYYQLGINFFQKKKFDEAKKCFEEVISRDHKYFDVNQCLANTLLELGDCEVATQYYFRQLEKNPFFETVYNLGVLLMMKDRLNDALNYFNQALKINPNDVSTHINCGNIYLKKNNWVEAARFYQHADTLKPNDPEIQHILSAIRGNSNDCEVARSAPASYIMHLFDQYAPYYETHLTQHLNYDVPQKMLDAVLLECLCSDEKNWMIIDLGCGTGLCGTLFKPYAKQLVGIDLSENMLEIARNKEVYDELICEDVAHALEKYSSVDLIVAADVFTYLGDLEDVFFNAHKALAANGLFIFTVEKTFDQNFILQKSIRYAHSKPYLESLAKAHKFEILRFGNIQLRKQKNEPIEGYLVLLQRHT